MRGAGFQSLSLISSIVIALWILANEVTSSTLRDRQLGMQVTEICRDLSASRPSFSLDFENSGGYSLWLAVNLVTLEHGAGESLEGFVLRKLEGGLKEKERRCLNAKEVSLPPIPDSVLPLSHPLDKVLSPHLQQDVSGTEIDAYQQCGAMRKS